jgi:hypothetical protein
MKKYIIAFVFLCLQQAAFAQIMWQKTYGGGINTATAVVQTTDGGYIVAGNDGSPVLAVCGPADIWVIKLSASGSLQWQKCLGGGGLDFGTSIVQSYDGGYVIAGFTNSTNGDVSGNHGNYDFWVIKLSSAGSIEWQKCMGGANDDEAESVLQTFDSGYIVAGYSRSTDGMFPAITEAVIIGW